MAGGMTLAPLRTEIRVDLDNFRNDMERAGEVGASEADRLSQRLSSTAKVGDTLSKAGSTLTKSLTVPIIGAGVAVTKMAVDYESSFAKVSTLLDSNVVNLDKYKNDILDASSESKVAVDEFSEAVYGSISAGVDQTKAIGFTTDAMKLAKGGFTDGASAVDILTTAINGYGMQAEDATKISDMLITTQNLGKTTVNELASSMGTVIPVANSVNFGMDELSASYAQLTKNGIATAESGTYLKAMLSELGKSGSITDKTLRDLTGKSFAQLKSEGASTTDILKILSDAAEKDGKTLKDMFGSVEAGSAALVLAKGDGAEYNEMLQGMQSSAGATQEAFDKMDSTPAERMKGALNELKNEGIKFGDAFIPVIEKVGDILGKAADAFSGLSEQQQQSVIKWGLVLAATGPVLKVVGGGISTFTKLSRTLGGASRALGLFGTAQAGAGAAASTASAAVGSAGLTGSMTGLLGICAPIAAGVAAVGVGLYAAHENSQLAKRSVNEASEEMSWMERVMAKLSGTEIHTREELEKMGYVHEEFSENISPEFQEAVEKSRKKVQDLNVYLHELGMDDVITQEESDAFVSRVKELCDEAIQTINSKKEEAQNGFRELMLADDGIIDESEQHVLGLLTSSYDNQAVKVKEHKDRIEEIERTAADEKRALRQEELEEIQGHYNKIAEIELAAVGGTQEEILYAKNEFKSQIIRMDADEASELLKQKSKDRDAEIDTITASYDTKIELAKAKASEMQGVEREQTEAQIKEWESDKEKKIQQQKDLYEEYLNIIEENNPKLMNAINKYNGEVLTNADKQSQKLLEKYKQDYVGLESVTESGCYRLYDTNRRTYSDVAVLVDEKTEQIIGFHDKTNNKTAGYCESMGNNAMKMANKTGAAFDQIVSAEDLYIDQAGNVVSKSSGISQAMTDVKEKTDGTREGIIRINDTPYKIEVSKKGTIEALEEIDDKANEVAKPRTIQFNAHLTGGAASALDFIKNQGNSSYRFNGLDNVPYDGYHAILHKNERVLTAEENKAYSSAPQVDYNAIRSIVRNELKGIVLEMNGREFGRAVRRV